MIKISCFANILFDEKIIKYYFKLKFRKNSNAQKSRNLIFEIKY